MSLRDRLKEPEKCGPALKLDLLLDQLEPEVAEELQELVADRTISGSQLLTLINQLCEENKVSHLKMKINTLNRYRRENL